MERKRDKGEEEGLEGEEKVKKHEVREGESDLIHGIVFSLG